MTVRRLVGWLVLAASFAAGPPAQATEPIDIRLSFEPVSPVKETFELGGLRLRATCIAVYENDAILRLTASSTDRRAYVSGSFSQVNVPEPSTPRDRSLKPGEQLTLIPQGQLEGVSGTVNFTDASGNQVSATIHADTFIDGSDPACLVGGTAQKGRSIDYRAQPGSRPQVVLEEDGTELRASCKGTQSNPELDLRLRNSEFPSFAGASWSQTQNTTSLTSFSESPAGNGVDPLVGIESRSAGTMSVMTGNLPFSVTFQADEGRPLGSPGCLFGGTLLTSRGFSLVGIAGPLGFGYSCDPSNAEFKARSRKEEAYLSASYSQVDVASALTAVDADANPSDPHVPISAGVQAAAGTALVSAPDGSQASATYALARGDGCGAPAFGNFAVGR